MEGNIVFRPAKRYLIKLYLKSLFSGAFTLGIAAFVFSNMGFDTTPFMVIGVIVLSIQLFTWVIATIYYYTIVYEIHSDEVIVRSGILTRTVKHVPFRTITNITTTRDIFDQLTGIGSLSIQTAGSGSVLAEEKLAGIRDLNDLYEFVARELRQFRNAISPTQGGEQPPVADEQRILIAILQELRAIRVELNRS